MFVDEGEMEDGVSEEASSEGQSPIHRADSNSETSEDGDVKFFDAVDKVRGSIVEIGVDH